MDTHILNLAKMYLLPKYKIFLHYIILNNITFNINYKRDTLI